MLQGGRAENIYEDTLLGVALTDMVELVFALSCNVQGIGIRV